MTLLDTNLFLISPTAIAFLPPLILQLIILGYLLSIRPKSKPTWLLIGWLCSLTVMVASQFLTYAIYAPISTFINWIGGLVPSLIAVLLFIQFAYRTPQFIFVGEARLVLLISSLLVIGMVGLMIYEAIIAPGVILYSFEQFTYDMVSEHNRQPVNSPNVFSIIHPLGYVWALLVWLRMAGRLIVANTAGLPPARRWLLLGQALWHPSNRDIKTARAFILYMLLAPLTILILRIEVQWALLPPGSFAASYLITIFIFVLIYINTSREPSTMMIKVVGISLVTLLTIVGILNRFIVDLWLATLEDRRYSEVTQIKSRLTTQDMSFIPSDVLYLARWPTGDGIFSSYHQLMFTQNNSITARQLNAEDNRLQLELDQGLVVAQRAVFHQLPWLGDDILSTPRLSPPSTIARAFRGVYVNPPQHYLRYTFNLDTDLYEVGYSYLTYRQLIHQTILPVVSYTIGAPLLVLLIFPAFFQTSLIHPLNRLLAGVKQIDRGNLQVQVPVAIDDEIGFLTRSFNRMVESLKTLNAGLHREIAERRLAEEIARANEHRYRQLFENAPLCILEIDLSSTPPRILQANRQAQLVYGWLAESFSHLSLEQLVPPEARSGLNHLSERVRAGETITLEATNLRRDGTTFPVRVSATPEQAANPSRMIVTVQDITVEKQRRSEVEAIAEDRRRIAREIHDSLAQTLAGLRFRARLWQRLLASDPTQLHPELDEMRVILDTSLMEVRRSIFALRPVNLEELGFFPALRQFVDDFSEQYQLPIHLDILGPTNRLPAYLELNLFRIIQESLNNVAKHAQANTVRVTINLVADDSITLITCDDGRGFNPATLNEVVQFGHMGLKQMRERVESIGGVLLIYSRPDQGTRLEITIPLISDEVSP